MTDVAPSSLPVQIESLQTNGPVSESQLQDMAGPINKCLLNIPPIGTVFDSMLTEPQYQFFMGPAWVLCDGRSVVGSAYQVFTTFTNVPDFRGRFKRMKDYGSGVDTHGDLNVGDLIADQAGPHTHVVNVALPASRFAAGGSETHPLYGVSEAPTSMSFASPGATAPNTELETNPKYGVVNFFIRIN